RLYEPVILVGGQAPVVGGDQLGVCVASETCQATIPLTRLQPRGELGGEPDQDGPDAEPDHPGPRGGWGGEPDGSAQEAEPARRDPEERAETGPAGAGAASAAVDRGSGLE